MRCRAVPQDRVDDMLALDVALRRAERDWSGPLPPAIERHVAAKLCYGHLFCRPFHQDYLIAKGADPHAIEHALTR